MLNISAGLARVKSNARMAAYHTRFGNVGSMIEAHSRQLEDCIHNPTTGLLARNRYCRPKNMFNNHFDMRRRMLENSPKIKFLTNIVNDRMNDLYPKTRKLREYIIDERRVSLDMVRPGRGYSLLDKIKIYLRK